MNIFASALLAGCSGAQNAPESRMTEPPPAEGRLFTKLPPSYTGVDFVNRLEDTRELNVFTYRNHYNGGGAALGDLTGDGLPELLLTSNQQGVRLYLNQGDFRFRDITEEAGLRGKRSWATGATFADVNGDGQLDIYIAFAGKLPPEERANELYVHRGMNAAGVPVFEEAAAAYGVADPGYTTHAAFFDYDGDGDLDLYLVNNSPRPVSSFDRRNTRHTRDEFGGDRLYRNDGDHFVDVSEAAGILGNEAAFGLGVAVGDVDGDGWPDLYVSNDFFERDYLYINRRDGTFLEVLETRMPSISYSSMGLDFADLNNDGRVDLYVTDMLPEDEVRLKSNTAFESWQEYRAQVKNGYHHQFTRNMLHLNNGDGTFTEIGQLAGVARTDWSWSALVADFDLDGHKDIHVTNGMPRDLTAHDYLAYLASDATLLSAIRDRKVDFLRLVREMTSTPLANYAFRNNGDLTFSNVAHEWGLDDAGFSNGAAYGDLDGDGALDLVVNNIDRPVSIYRNNARDLLPDHHYLQVHVEGGDGNRFAVGAAVTIRQGGTLLFQEVMPSRGFQSSVDHVLTFGLGKTATVDSVTVDWPGGLRTVVRGVEVNRRLTVEPDSAAVMVRAAPGVGGVGGPAPASEYGVLFRDVTRDVALDFVHVENEFNDFEREPLLPRLLSTEGPALAVADVNGDGLDDLYLGGAKDQPGRLFVQRRGGGFISVADDVFDRDRTSEDVAAVFFDADGDGHADLYVVSGGSEFSDMAPALLDRLYLNDGRGSFRKAEDRLPGLYISGARVVAADYDGDGDSDLFVGGRARPWRYGEAPRSVLLQNDGRGGFTDVTASLAPELEHIGMVTDAVWADFDGDGRRDLVVVGDWMPITLFRNMGGGRLALTSGEGLEHSHGWWNRIVAEDLDGDGRVDFVVGNAGLNTRLRPARERPLAMFVKDFDRNGFIEQIVVSYEGRDRYPIAMRDDLLRALPQLAARFPRHQDYAGRPLEQVLSSAELDGAIERTAYTFASVVVRNEGDGRFKLTPLPIEAQVAPVHTILARDVDGDGRLDLLLAGNFDGVPPQIGALRAGQGIYLRGDAMGRFLPVSAVESGFRVPGQARQMERVRTAQGDIIVVARNHDAPLIFRAARSVATVAARR